MKEKNFQRKLLLGGGTAAGIVIFLGIVVAVQYITVKNPKRWDLTSIGEHTLAPQSKKILQTLKEKKKPVHVLAFYETQDDAQRQAARDLFDQYRDVDSDFTYSFIDPDMDRAAAHKHKVDSYPTLVLKAGEREERIEKATEEELTNALARLLRTDVKKVYFLKGHGELSPNDTDPDGLSIAGEQIGKQNYTVEELLLLQSSAVPPDATILIVAGPKADLLEQELEAIAEHLKRGGALMVLLNPFHTPKFAEFLKTYGVDAGNDIVVDRMSRALGGDYLIPVITQYNESPITKDFKLASFFPETRSIRVPKEPVPSVTAKEIALTSEVSWTISKSQLDSGDANFDPKTGTKGPVPVMAVSTYTNYESLNKIHEQQESTEGEDSGKKEAETGDSSDKKTSETSSEMTGPIKARIAAFGSSHFASNKFYNLSGNRDLFLNTVSWLAADENLIAIRPKSRSGEPLVLTGKQSWAVVLIPVVFLPLAWIVAGLFVYVYRKRTAAA
ncbi:MAG: Gldg family protein [Desulfomonilaceae bacterium]|nr:Gldg family protein [Desulfomonilaceae bacterium]